MKINNTKIPYSEFKDRFQKMDNNELLNALKEQVGKPGWVKAREFYMSYLHEEIKNRGLDFSIIGDDKLV